MKKMYLRLCFEVRYWMLISMVYVLNRSNYDRLFKGRVLSERRIAIQTAFEQLSKSRKQQQEEAKTALEFLFK